MSAPVLRLEGVRHGFSGTPVLKGMDLTLEAGEILCLLGPSGCGKTTSLLVCAGIERPDGGRVLARNGAGEMVELSSPSHFVPPEKRGIGLVFQDYALFPHMNLLANTGFGLKGAGKKARARRWLEVFGLAARENAFPHQLSGGEQQRAALARSLAPEPNILLLDEPFSSLDRHLRLTLREEIRTLLKEAKTAVIFVTHDPEEAMRMGDKVALMRDGKVVQAGLPAELYDYPADSGAAQFFGEVNLLSGAWRDGIFTAAPFSLPVAEPPPKTARLLVRPESFSLIEGEGEQSLTGKVLSTTRAGSDWVIKLTPQNHEDCTLIARPRAIITPPQDAPLRLFYHPAKLRLLPE